MRIVLRTQCWPAVGLALGLLLTGCTPDEHNSTDAVDSARSHSFQGEPPLSIFCTTGQVADAVRQVAGNHAEVSSLMGPGVDPHLFRPQPSHVMKLKNADIVFYNGLHLEGRIIETLEKLSETKPVYAVTAGLVEQRDPRLRKPPEFDGYYDPHVWHDARLWADCVEYVAERLAEFDGERAENYGEAAQRYREELAALDDYCRDELAQIPEQRRLLVTAHDAFGYFSAAYDIKTIGIKGISTEDQADFQHVDEIRRILVERKIPAVFVESSTSPRLINQLIEECRAAGHEVRKAEELYSDSLGPAGSGAEDYVGMMRSNVSSIVAGLTGG